MIKRRFVSGDGWRFELIDNELYFANHNSQWNHNVKNISLCISDENDIVYVYDIRVKGNHICIFRMFIDPILLRFSGPYTPRWLVTQETFLKIRVFLNKVLK